MRVLVALLVWLAAIAGGIGVSSVVAASVHNEQSSSGSDSGGGAGPVDISEITSTDSHSLFNTTNFSEALSIVSQALGSDAQVDSFTVYPGYVSVQAVKNKLEIDYYLDANGNHDETTSTALPTGDVLFPLSAIPSDFPAVIASKIATLAHTPESQLHYLIAETDPDSKKLQWFAYPASGGSISYFQMNAPRGRLFEQPPSGALKRVKG